MAIQNQHETLTVLADEKRNRWHHRALTMILKLSKAKKQTITPLLQQTRCSRISSTMLENPLNGAVGSRNPPRPQPTFPPHVRGGAFIILIGVWGGA